MADKLSLSNLLSLLQVDQQSDDIVRKLHDNTEVLRWRRCYEDAIKAAQDAVLLVRNKFRFNYNLHGVTLLYLSSARLSYNLPNHNKQAIRDCNEAITYLRFEPHNYAIAEIIRAQIELKAYSDDTKSTQNALAHFQRSAEILRKLSTDWRVPGNLKQIETELLSAVNAKISELVTLQSSVPPIPLVPKQAGRLVSAMEQADESASVVPVSIGPGIPPIHLPIPTQLVWPLPDAFGFGLSPVYGGSTPDQSRGGIQPRLSLDYVEVSQFSINGKPYAIYPTSPASNNSGVLRLHQGQQYIAIQINGDGDKTARSDQYVLVRCQDQPDQSGQKIVVADLPHKRVWVWVVDDFKSIPPKIIGGTDGTHGESQDERQWKISDGSETVHYGSDEIRIIGIVEAVLAPIVPFDPSSLPASVTLPE